jgi:hypothetical protein
MLLAEIDLKGDAIVILVGILIQGGALTALGILWKHHINTVRAAKRESDKRDSEHSKALERKDDALKDIIAAKDKEIKAREDACREELAACQASMHDMEVEFRKTTERLLREALDHDAEMLTQIRAELKSGGNS